MLTKLPPWIIGVIGGLFVVLSTIVSSYYLAGIDSEISDNRKTLAKIDRNISSLWDNHQLADRRSTAADQFVGLYLMAKSNKEYYLVQAGQNLRGSVLAMYAATELDVPDEPPKEIMLFEKKLGEGDLSAYSRLKQLIDTLRLKSKKSINNLKKKRDRFVEKNEMLNSKKDFIRLLYVSLNILGLIIVLLKDLPVWSKQQD